MFSRSFADSERPHTVFCDPFYPLKQKLRPAQSRAHAAELSAADSSSKLADSADERMFEPKSAASKKNIAFAKLLYETELRALVSGSSDSE